MVPSHKPGWGDGSANLPLQLDKPLSRNPQRHRIVFLDVHKEGGERLLGLDFGTLHSRSATMICGDRAHFERHAHSEVDSVSAGQWIFFVKLQEIAPNKRGSHNSEIT